MSYAVDEPTVSPNADLLDGVRDTAPSATIIAAAAAVLTATIRRHHLGWVAVGSRTGQPNQARCPSAVRRAAEGATVAELMEEFGRNENAITTRLARIGVGKLEFGVSPP